jgi:hypothetical protein
LETSELIKFGILAIIVAVIALVARRGQAHSTGVPPQKPDPATADDADRAGDEHSAAPKKDARTAAEAEAKRRERRR